MQHRVEIDGQGRDHGERETEIERTDITEVVQQHGEDEDGQGQRKGQRH